MSIDIYIFFNLSENIIIACLYSRIVLHIFKKKFTTELSRESHVISISWVSSGTASFVWFRWKGENVSTVEVSNVVCSLDWIEDANVYGVSMPGNTHSV